MIIVPEIIGSIIGVYNGKTFNHVEIKTEMIAHYLAEFFISYKPMKHGRPVIGATHSSSRMLKMSQQQQEQPHQRREHSGSCQAFSCSYSQKAWKRFEGQAYGSHQEALKSEM